MRWQYALLKAAGFEHPPKQILMHWPRPKRN